MTTFAEQHAALQLASREALDGWWEYYSRTRDKSPTGYPRFKRTREAAEQTLARLAAIEEVVGYDKAEEGLKQLEWRARARKRERDGP
jgi:hypothetical protein